MDDPHGLTRVPGVGAAADDDVGAGAEAPPKRTPSSADDHQLHEVRRAVAGEYDVLGELCEVGQGSRAGPVFLAVQRGSTRLEVLRLLRDAGYVEVLGAVGEALLSAGDSCPTCGKPIRAVRFCGNCRADLAAMQLTPSPGSISVADWQAAKGEAGKNNYDLLGQLREPHGGPPGGSILLAARMSNTSRLVALVLDRAVAGSPAVLGLDQTNRLAGVIEALFETAADPVPVVVPERAIPATEIRGAPPAPPPVPEPGPEHPAWMRIAAIALSSAAVIAAVAWLVTALSGPSARPDDPAAAPATMAAGVVHDTAPLDSAQPSVAVVDSATLRISAEVPAGTSITVDGTRVSGSTVRLAPGLHRLVATAPGYRTARRTVEATAGQSLTWPPPMVAVPKPPVAPSPPGSPCRAAVGRNDWTRALVDCADEASSARGSAYAERMLGTMYERGLGVAPSQTLAVVWYSASAARGDREAQYRYALMLQNGTGVRRNQPEAARLYRMAADQGHAEAQLALGLLHVTGDGVARSETEAQRWLRRAAAQGNQRAREELRQRGW